MATHAEPPSSKLTIEQFLVSDATRDGKYELVDGEARMMARANRRHVRIMGNILRRLAERLEGGPCEAFAADMGLAVSEFTYRLPDVAIYCDPRDLGPAEVEPMVLRYPKVIIEIMSPSTEHTDYGAKLDEYQRLPSVDTIVVVHPRTQAVHHLRACRRERMALDRSPARPSADAERSGGNGDGGGAVRGGGVGAVSTPSL